MEEKGEKPSANRLIISMLCAAGALVLLLVSAVSLGWFTDNKTVEGGSMGLTATDNIFELGAENRAGSFDAYLSSKEGESLSNIPLSGGGSINLSATGEGKPEIKWQISENSNFGNDTANGIQPGSAGKLTFYVIAKRSGNLSLKFSLDTILYDKTAAENADNTEHIIPAGDVVNDYVKGHILFFGEYSDGVYSRLLTEDNFTFTQFNAQKNTAYKVDFYWVWPLFADQIILPKNDGILSASGYKRIIADDVSVINGDNLSRFFAESDITYDMVENMAAGSDKRDFNADYYSKINEKWNRADQFIGTTVGYVELQLTADIAADNG